MENSKEKDSNNQKENSLPEETNEELNNPNLEKKEAEIPDSNEETEDDENESESNDSEIDSLKSLMDTNFMEYASYVIKDRAIPNIDDGLKPVQRRILHTLFEVHDSRYHKVANIVGHTMRYHPHGDASIYAALVNISQKNYFIDQQGNFGNIITGDPASAARYIECRLSPMAVETLYSPEITKFEDSYDGRNKEPVVLPAKLPNLLMSGVEGIAVGLATKILPHNFNELLNAQISILKKEDFEIYPDFQQGGTIDVSEYDHGKGKVKVRAKIEIADPKKLIITEVPYGVTTENLIGSIENAINKGKLKINSINDFTAENVEIELNIGHGAYAEEILPRLYLYTDCEVSITSNVIVIQDSNPIETDVNQILRHNTNKLVIILNKELKKDLNKLEIKLHDRTLTKLFIKNKVYSYIESAKSMKELNDILMEKLNEFSSELKKAITLADIDKLLSIPIKRIAKFDLDKLVAEIEGIENEIDEINKYLSDIKKYTIKYLKNMLKKYGAKYPRKTALDTFENIDVKKVAVQDLKVSYDKKSNYMGTQVKSDDIINCSSFDKILIFFKNGDYQVIPIPEKVFIDKKILFFDKQSSLTKVSVIYLNQETNTFYMKRFIVKKFIQDKMYTFIPKGSKLIYFTTDETPIVQIDYQYLKRAKLKSEYIHLGRLNIKSVSSMGNKVSNKPILKVKSARKSVKELFEENPDSMRMRVPNDETKQPTLFDGETA